MSACVDIEIRLTPLERARARDSFVRSFERTFRQWQEIAKCCLEVKRDGDWELLGFHSFEAWLGDAAPASRRYIFLVMGIHDDLSHDIPDEILDKIPLGTGQILHREVKSKALRRDPRILEAATHKPKKFVSTVKQIAPEQHLEGYQVKKLNFSVSQAETVEDGWDAYRHLEDETISLEAFIEWVVNDWLDGLAQGGPTSRRMTWEGIKERAHKDQKRQNSQDRAVIH